jgi:hypothetical protein
MPLSEHRQCPVPTCDYSVTPNATKVKENLHKHIAAMRKKEKMASSSLQPHVNFDFSCIGYNPRIGRADLKSLTPEERTKRRSAMRRGNQRCRRQESKQNAKVQAAALGDVSLYPRLEKTLEYQRKAAEKRWLDENYKFSSTHSLLASEEMGGLFCFYLHFSLAVTVSEDLDQQSDKVATLIQGLRAAYPGNDGDAFRTVGVP